MASKLPAGSWQQSASSATYDGTTLRANLTRTDGSQNSASVNLASPSLSNLDGFFVPDESYPGLSARILTLTDELQFVRAQFAQLTGKAAPSSGLKIGSGGGSSGSSGGGSSGGGSSKGSSGGSGLADGLSTVQQMAGQVLNGAAGTDGGAGGDVPGNGGNIGSDSAPIDPLGDPGFDPSSSEGGDPGFDPGMDPTMAEGG